MPSKNPPRRLEYVRLPDIELAPRNPKGHDERGIARSIGHHGVVEVPVRDERTGRLVAGHGRYAQLVAMRDAGQSPPDGVLLDDDGEWKMPVLAGWSSRSDEDAEAYLIGSNQLVTLGGWADERELVEMLGGLADVNLLELTGFCQSDLDDRLAELAEASAAKDEEPSDDSELEQGEGIALAGVTVGEPEITALRGQVWRLGDRHTLVVADVHTDWQRWSHYLEGDALFWPYPTPLAPFAEQATRHPVVMVQPNLYLAGWLLTKWQRITGETPVLVESAQ